MPVRLSITAAESLIVDALTARDAVARHNAESVARALVAAEIDGQQGHGFIRVAAYAAQALSGKVDGHATPAISQPRSASLLVDAGNGFAFPAIDQAISSLRSITPDSGVALAAIYRSHHCGQLGSHVESLAKHGLAALMLANAPSAIAPWGGTKAVFGTNPIAFAAPRVNAPPLVIDLSLSKVARGKVLAAKKSAIAIPQGWALDYLGMPTTDPDAALAGTMIPAGGAKGAALALIVEILAATLIGANHSFEASSFFDSVGEPPSVGQTIVAFDTKLVAGFGGRIETLLAAITSQPSSRLPGAGKTTARQLAASEGIEIPDYLLAEIDEITKD